MLIIHIDQKSKIIGYNGKAFDHLNPVEVADFYFLIDSHSSIPLKNNYAPLIGDLSKKEFTNDTKPIKARQSRPKQTREEYLKTLKGKIKRLEREIRLSKL